MTTELATTNPTSSIAVQQAQMSIAEKVEYAKLLADAGMIPDSYRKQPGNVLAAIEYGQALGLEPIIAMSQILVVKGKATMEAKLMISLARKAGHVVRLSGDAESATCELILADDPQNPRAVTWTKQMAESHGLWGAGHWQKDPALMLQYRAASQAIRLHCPEVLAGISYTPEEAKEIAQRNNTRTTVVQVPTVKAEKSAGDYMKSLGLTGSQLKEFSTRALGKRVASWEKLSDSERSTVLDGLATWEAHGEDPTLIDVAEGELVDLETGEVTQ